ncbi:P1 family peptidase [Aquibacillus koreensis]|uniref:P1 family peptidase n=1 Tax=Aquibacillus koreensis TaxID=279446 RepID=A0A9X3WPK7_9BACI|nr:P1 family peptidase [Aquibacillus koreensis]MCT2536089.1 P1 family peptidase [Aquibacillus koreensis]MDC3422805.1 P1 family peptidase [Aquibacillus koreensis]
MRKFNIHELDDFKIGHDQNYNSVTGCTVILCEKGATTGVDVRGGAPGTRETDVLKPENLVDHVHGVFLTGGSAYGLDVAAGVMKYLEEINVGFDVQVAKVPIVTGAVLFDLAIGDAKVRPDKYMGYQACLNTVHHSSQHGSIGAGTGATVGKCLGPDYAMKSGIGTYALQIGELKVGAIVAVNSFGDIIDPGTNQIIAGAYDRVTKTFLNTEKQMANQLQKNNATNRFSGNTTIGTIMTNAKLTKAQANKIASMAHDGIARTMRPAHTMVDGDTIFSMAVGDVDADISTVGMLAAKVMEQAILEAIKASDDLVDVPGYQSVHVEAN